MPDGTDVRVYREDPPLETIFDVRRTVFVDGQGIAAADEFDGRDETTIQFLAIEENEPVGTARLRTPEESVGKVERVAVLPPYRGEGWGRAIVKTVEDVGRETGIDALVLHAQTTAEGFYRALGYERTSDVYREVGIPHVTMEKQL